MTIDAHVHVWDLAHARYPWLTEELGHLHRSIGFDEIDPVLRERGITGAVLVQASDEAADTEVMRAAATAHPAILGIVAFSPLDDPDTLRTDLERFADDPLVVGLRNLVHERPAGWIDQPSVDRSLALLAAHGLPLDIPTADLRGLAPLPGIGARHPGLRLVIDHLGKPPIGGDAEERERWRELFAACAENPATVAKLSGLYAAHGPLHGWTVAQVRPFVEDALELFGPGRLLYGGDWPISELAGGYARTFEATTELLAELSDAERAAILEGTARRVYGLGAEVAA